MSVVSENYDLNTAPPVLSFEEFKANLLSGLKELDYKNETDVFKFLNTSLESGNKLNMMMEEFKDILLNEMRWDNKNNCTYDISSRSKHLNEQLYNISVIFNKFSPTKKNVRFFNFECLLNNFKIKFIYHFNNNNNKFDMDIMTSFIKSYFDENLFNGIRIVLEGDIDLTFEEAVNHFIMEINKILKKKLQNTINNNNDLIMKIFKFNNFLNQEYGVNCKLYDIIAKQHIQDWIKFEIQLINQYYSKNFNKTQFQLNDGANLNKYLHNLFDYFKPFLVLEVDLETRYILQFKIMIFQKIILQILQFYRSGIDVNNKSQDNILLPGSLLQRNFNVKDSNGVLMGYSYLNFQKNIILIYDNLLKLSKNQIIIMINSNFNELINEDNEGMHSLLEGEIIEYKKLIVKNFNNMVIPFIKKTSRDNLSEYINLNWYSIVNKQMYDHQVWLNFFESNNNLLKICKNILVDDDTDRPKNSSLDLLLQSQFDKLQTVNDSLIIKSITNNILLAYKLTIDQEIVINILVKDISSLNVQPKTLVEWVKFQDYTRLINLLIYKEMNQDLLNFDKSEESIFQFQKIYQLESLTVQEIQKVWQIFI
ncbi:hypothetical protein ACO0SA_001323 [Hanseniaspora valbyensis]